MRKLAAIMLFGLTFSSTATKAQYEPGTFMYFDYLANNTAVNIGIMGQQKYHQDDDDNQDKEQVLKRLLEQAKKQPARTVKPADFVFPVSQPTRKATLNVIVQGLSKDNPSARKELEAVLIQQDIFGLLDTGIEKYGMRTNNLADAYTLYWINSWEAVHNSYSESTPEQIKAVKAQVFSFLSNVDALHNMSATEKQQLSDTMVVNAVLLEMMAEGAKTNPQIQQMRSQAGRAGAAAFGVIVDGITLTNTGFTAN